MRRRDKHRVLQRPRAGEESATSSPGVLATSERALAVARSLATDRMTADVVQALRQVGVRSILLKGPASAKWLYEDGFRPYLDSDLLVKPTDVPTAERVLSQLGFEHPGREDLPLDRPWHAHFWVRRGPGDSIDLHRTLIGVGVPPEELWRVLSGQTETMRVGGLDLEVLNAPARALHVALHAAQDGPRVGKPLQDLARALDRVPEVVWQDALAIARDLDALPAFATGLRLLPAGGSLASRLGLPLETSVEVALRATNYPELSLGFEWLASTPGIGRKLAFLGHKLLPPPAFMRAWSPIARRGRWGLIVAYVWRLIWLLAHAGPGFWAWWQAKKRTA